MDLYEDEPTEWRLGNIIHIKSIVNSDGLTDAFEEFLDDVDPKYNPEIFEQMPVLKVALTHGMMNRDILELFWDRPESQEGLLVKVEAQIPEYKTETIFAIGWGYYTSKWVWVKTIEEAELIGHNFSKELHEKAKQKAA